MPMPRVAFFTDSYSEANGVASLSREFVAFAQREGLPFLCVHSGEETRVEQLGAVTDVSLRRGPLAFPVDDGMYCDPFLMRHSQRVAEALDEFAPDVVHLTGPGDVGVLGARLAFLKKIPYVASWHTNLHEYAGRRVNKMFGWLGQGVQTGLARAAEQGSLAALLWFYRIPWGTMAPNAEYVELLARRTGKPSCLMLHGVDLERFHPGRRRENEQFTIGYVGRLTAEKNVRLFVELERALEVAGVREYRLELIGEGSERGWLEANLRKATLLGVLRGDELADRFAAMDAFVFPSETDTFGLVVLEAMASGVPVLVARGGGPQTQVEEGRNGFVCGDAQCFASALAGLAGNVELRRRMGARARAHASDSSWNRVFTGVLDSYDGLIAERRDRQRLAAVAR